MIFSRNSLTLTNHVNYSNLVIGFIAISFCLRLIWAALLPLSGDEALYWSYSKHLAWGYIDHPVINPFLIKVGTSIFGDTSFGVRIAGLCLSLASSWAVWNAAALLIKTENAGPTAALLFNLTIALTVGSFIATSDSAVMTMSSFLLYFLAKLETSEDPRWWMPIGIAIGLGMLSKYTMIFMALGILLWAGWSPMRRKWIVNPWSLIGVLISIAIFAPVLFWNFRNEWSSIIYQAGRTNAHTWSLKYLGDLIASQLAYLTPPVFILGAIGLLIPAGSSDASRSIKIMLLALILPISVYFIWHSLHSRVEGNWLQVMFPAYAVLATSTLKTVRSRTRLASVALWLKRLAVPFGIVMACLVYVQAMFNVVPKGRKDPTSRELAFGWSSIAEDITRIRNQTGAEVILTSDYTTLAWLRFGFKESDTIIQLNERMRWVNEPSPKPAFFDNELLYICRDDCSFLPDIESGFIRVELQRKLTRKRDGLGIETYSVYLLSDPISPPFELIEVPLVKGQPMKESTEPD